MNKYNDGIWYAIMQSYKIEAAMDLTGMTETQKEEYHKETVKKLYNEYIATH